LKNKFRNISTQVTKKIAFRIGLTCAPRLESVLYRANFVEKMKKKESEKAINWALDTSERVYPLPTSEILQLSTFQIYDPSKII